MSKTYGITNYISSFGFTELWRKQCVSEIDWNDQIKIGYDLMSGMGECWSNIYKKASPKVKIIGVDNSTKMNELATKNLQRHPNWNTKIISENILQNSIEPNSADFITSAFGLKTFSNDQLKILAQQISRILKPGGQFALIEVSVPQNFLLKMIYMFYLKTIIPIIGKLFSGNSGDYKMLGIYCENFSNCKSFKLELEQNGLNVYYKNYFFGCASGVFGEKK